MNIKINEVEPNMIVRVQLHYSTKPCVLKILEKISEHSFRASIIEMKASDLPYKGCKEAIFGFAGDETVFVVN